MSAQWEPEYAMDQCPDCGHAATLHPGGRSYDLGDPHCGATDQRRDPESPGHWLELPCVCEKRVNEPPQMTVADLSKVLKDLDQGALVRLDGGCCVGRLQRFTASATRVTLESW